jgi:hypothetical protein
MSFDLLNVNTLRRNNGLTALTVQQALDAEGTKPDGADSTDFLVALAVTAVAIDNVHPLYETPSAGVVVADTVEPTAVEPAPVATPVEPAPVATPDPNVSYA